MSEREAAKREEAVVGQGDASQESDDLYCPACQYHLRGVASDRCPECGLDIVDVKARKLRIPWELRRQNGHRRTYLATIRMVALHFPAFLHKTSRPILLADAKVFRHVTLVIVLFVLVLTTLGVAFGETTIGQAPEWYRPIAIAMVSGITVAAFLMTAIPFYAFRHRQLELREQHEAAIFCLYSASGKFAGMSIVLPLIGLAILAGDHGREMGGIYLFGGLALAAFLVFAIWGLIDLILVVRDTFRERSGGSLLTLKIVALWLAGIVFSVVVLPAMLVYLAFAYCSLT